MIRWLAIVLLLAGHGCSGRQGPERPSVRALLRNGRYAEAVTEAERLVRENPGQPRHLAVLAVAHAAAEAPAAQPAQAIATLRQAANASSRGRAADDFAAEAAGSNAFQQDRFATAAATVLALLADWTPERADTDATRAATGVLVLAAHGAEAAGTVDAVTRLLERAGALIDRATEGFAFGASDVYAAWVCFRSAGLLADAASRGRARELSWAAAELAVRIVEANPDLAIPIECDLSSPKDLLRDVLRYDQGLLRRFEDALESATGCAPGTYAPSPPSRP
jgi:hypothetical protein